MLVERKELEKVIKSTITLWKDNSEYIENRIKEWADLINEKQEAIALSRKQFHQRKPLRIYSSITRFKNKGKVRFSLRFHGQGVGEVVVTKGGIHLKASAYAKTNKKYFELDLSPEVVGGKICDEWDSSYGRQFRSYFIKNEQTLKSKVRIMEHRVESTFIAEMEKKSKTKFGGYFYDIQPVEIAGCPFQMPVPISANKGKQSLKEQEGKLRDGNVDIMARRRGARISVWELKRPRTLSKAVEQVIIYSTTLLLMLRTKDIGERWYKLLEISRKLPAKLNIEAVVAVTEREFNKLITENKVAPLKVGNDSIRLYAACYDEETFMVKDFKAIAMDN